MRISHPYGSKERLFEMFEKVNNFSLNEEQSIDDKKKIIVKFVEYVNKELVLNGNLPEITLDNNSETAQEMKSFGKYTPQDNTLLVVIHNRNLADILRTIAHELIHHKQHLNGELDVNSSETGSDVENDANALAGVFMREFAKNNPIIFE